ncbi:hypothetical protein [Sulfurimonas sp. HSL3-7]
MRGEPVDLTREESELLTLLIKPNSRQLTFAGKINGNMLRTL